MDTKLMTKLYSDGNEELKATVNEKIDEAKQNGSASLTSDDEQLEFAAVGDSVIIEDKSNGEITEATVDEDEVNLAAVKTESETQPDVRTDITPGKDGKHETGTQPDAQSKVDEGVDDLEKSGTKNFSIKFPKGTDPNYIASVVRVFAEAGTNPDVEIVDEEVKTEETPAEPAEPANEDPTDDPEPAEGNEQEPEEPSEETQEKVAKISEMATKLKSDAKEMMTKQDVELAKQVKADAAELDEFCDSCGEEIDSEDIKSYAKVFSKMADELIAEKEAEPAKEESKDPQPEDPKDPDNEETKAECSADKTFSACKGLFDSISAPNPRYLAKGDRTFSNGTEKPAPSCNPFLTTPIH